MSSGSGGAEGGPVVTAGVGEGATAGVVQGRAVAEGGATAEEVVAVTMAGGRWREGRPWGQLAEHDWATSSGGGRGNAPSTP